MWIRGIAGVVVCLIGALWIAQGTNLVHGSAMSGHGLYAVLGIALVVIGLALLARAWRIRTSRPKSMA